jgi:hypothetical protein
MTMTTIPTRRRVTVPVRPGEEATIRLEVLAGVPAGAAEPATPTTPSTPAPEALPFALTYEQAGKLIGVSAASIKVYGEQYGLPVRRIGGLPRVLPDELRAWLVAQPPWRDEEGQVS